MSTILIVDDDETVLELIASTVRFLGYTSLSTLYPTQTFRILEKNSIDLILLDVYMPVLDGIALLRQIISHPVYKKIPVIILTGDEDEKLLERCFESGAVDFITKPVKKMVLKSRIKSALSSKEYIRQLGDLAEKSLSDYKQQMYAFSLATTNMLWNWDLINNTVERNIGFEKAFGYTKEEIVPDIEWWVDRLHPDDSVRVLSIYENAVKEGDSTCSYEYRFRLSNGNYSYISDNVYIVRDENGKAIRAIGAMTDITERKEAEGMRQKHNKALEQKNLALREVLSMVELEKKEMRDNVIANAENLLLPIIEKIRLKGESRKYTNLLEKSLRELTSSFGTKLTSKEAKLTSREIEICNMIKNGLANVEIADLLNISSRTVEKHRNNIRTKLGIRKKDINLASFLKTL